MYVIVLTEYMIVSFFSFDSSTSASRLKLIQSLVPLFDCLLPLLSSWHENYRRLKYKIKLSTKLKYKIEYKINYNVKIQKY